MSARNIRVKMTDEDVLRRFEEIVGYGTVHGPYNYAYRDGIKAEAGAPIEAILLPPAEEAVATVSRCGPVNSLP